MAARKKVDVAEQIVQEKETSRRNEALVEVGEKKVKKPRGRGPLPNERRGLNTPEGMAEVSKIMHEVLHEFRKPKVRDDLELAQRIEQYFEHCAETGQAPTVEEMALSTGYTVNTLWDWENGRNHGFSPQTSAIVKKAKFVLQTFDAKLVISGRLNFLAYCFRAKNYYGMTDKQEYTIAPAAQDVEQYSIEDIKSRYQITGDDSDAR